MKLRTFIFFGLFFVFGLCNGQPTSWLWAKQSNAFSSMQVAGTGSDALGNSYTIGYSYSGIQFSSLPTLPRGGFIVKYNPQGFPVWSTRIGAVPAAIATDADGNSYITGYFGDTLQIGNHSLICRGLQDIFLIRIDSAGTVIWAKQAGGIGYPPSYQWMPPVDEDRASCLALDAAGNCYIGATVIASDTSAAIFDSVAVMPPVHSLSPRRFNVLAKYHKSGKIQWIKTTDVQIPIYRALAVSKQGQCFGIGMFRTSLTLGQTTLTGAGQEDICITKYDANGNLTWAKSFGSVGTDYGNAIAVDKTGNIFITGAFRNNINFGSTLLTKPPGSSATLYVAKLDAAGNPIWASQATNGYSSESTKIVLDSAGNSYVGGMFSGQFQVGQQTFSTPFTGTYDVFVNKWNSLGIPLWTLAGQGGGDDWPNGLAYDPVTDGCYFSGTFGSTINFGSTSLYTPQFPGFFLAKLGPNVTGMPEFISPATKWVVYPNPATSYFSVKQKSAKPIAKGSFLLYNSTGQLVREVAFSKATQFTINRENLPGGLYWYKLLAGDKIIETGKVVLQ